MKTFTRSCSYGIALLGITLLTVTQAKAAVIYDAFNVGDTFDPFSGNNIFGSTSGIFYEDTAVQFSTGGFSGNLTSIELPLVSFFAPTPTQVSFSLTSSSGNAPDISDSILESWTITVSGNAPSIYTLTSAGGIALSPNTDYWLTAGATTSADSALWNIRTTGQLGNRAFRATPGGAWLFNGNSGSPALRVSGAIVTAAAPEPSTLSLLALGVLGGLTGRRRRQSQTAEA